VVPLVSVAEIRHGASSAATSVPIVFPAERSRRSSSARHWLRSIFSRWAGATAAPLPAVDADARGGNEHGKGESAAHRGGGGGAGQAVGGGGGGSGCAGPPPVATAKPCPRAEATAAASGPALPQRAGWIPSIHRRRPSSLSLPLFASTPSPPFRPVRGGDGRAAAGATADASALSASASAGVAGASASGDGDARYREWWYGGACRLFAGVGTSPFSQQISSTSALWRSSLCPPPPSSPSARRPTVPSRLPLPPAFRPLPPLHGAPSLVRVRHRTPFPVRRRPRPRRRQRRGRSRRDRTAVSSPQRNAPTATARPPHSREPRGSSGCPRSPGAPPPRIRSTVPAPPSTGRRPFLRFVSTAIREHDWTEEVRATKRPRGSSAPRIFPKMGPQQRQRVEDAGGLRHLLLDRGEVLLQHPQIEGRHVRPSKTARIAPATVAEGDACATSTAARVLQATLRGEIARRSESDEK